MVQRVHVVLEDDLEGGEASETINFSIDGNRYEIDLNERNAENLRKSLADFIAHARRQGGRKLRSGPEPAEIRKWAREHGYEVPERGRIPARITEAYNA